MLKPSKSLVLEAFSKIDNPLPDDHPLLNEVIAHVTYIFTDHKAFVEYYRFCPVDFVLDWKTGLIFVNIRYSHAELMRWLMVAHITKLPEHPLYPKRLQWDNSTRYPFADAYIEEGFGIYRSTAVPYIFSNTGEPLPEPYRLFNRDLQKL